MVKIIILLCCNFISLAKAATYHLSCISTDNKAVIEATIKDNKMQFTYSHIDGKKYFPLYFGPVSVSKFKLINTAKNSLQKINNKLQMEWPLEKCSIDDQQLFILSCSGEAQVIYPAKTNLIASSFSTSMIQEQTLTFSFESLKVRFFLQDNDQKYEIAFPFSKERCTVNWDTKTK
jgi:hypothetical protein